MSVSRPVRASHDGALARLRVALLAFVATLACVNATAQPLPATPPIHASLGVSGPARVTREIDIARLLPALDALRVDERSDQLLDWSVQGMLLTEGLDARSLRDALHDLPPVRDPGLDDLVDLPQGGRRVVVGARTLLFYSAFDRRPKVTLARLVDQVRMERGTTPATFEVYRCSWRVAPPSIIVERLDDLPATRALSSDYGYHEQVVTSAEELRAFLGQVDDVTLVKRDAGGVRLGGRRFGEARTLGVDIDDVAALYQAQRPLVDVWSPVLEGRERESALVDAMNALVRIARSSVASGQATDLDAFDQGVARVETLLGGADRAVQRHATVRAQVAAVQGLTPRVQTAQGRLVSDARRAQHAIETRHLPPGPGFSLDPEWDRAGLAQDLQTLLDDPDALVRRAHEGSANPDARTRGGTQVDFERLAVRANIPPGHGDRLRDLLAPFRGRITAALAAVRGARDTDQAEAAFDSLRDETTAAATPSAALLQQLLDVIASTRRQQCARYDGALQGTRVGMTLFYTDLVAKLWSLEVGRDVPADEVLGFPSQVRLFEQQRGDGPDRNRLWFAPRADRMTRMEHDAGLQFASVAARIFAKGSTVAGGREGVPREPVRRFITWWNRNYARVADFEPQYHRQNEILKWSVTTAWLAREGLLSDLARVQVDTSWRFRRWVQENGRDLKLREVVASIDQLPDDTRRTECLPVLSSRLFRGGSSAIVGGVDAGSLTTFRETVVTGPGLGDTVRRGGASASTAGYQVAARSVSVTLPEPASRSESRATVVLTDRARAVAAASQRRASQMEVRVSTGGGRGGQGDPPGGATAPVGSFEVDPDRGHPLNLAAYRSESGPVVLTLKRGGVESHSARGPPAGSSFAEALGHAIRGQHASTETALVHAISAEHAPLAADLLRASATFEQLGDPQHARQLHEMSAAPSQGALSVELVHGHAMLVRSLDGSPVGPAETASTARTQVLGARNGGHVHIYADAGSLAHHLDLLGDPVSSVTAMVDGGLVSIETVSSGDDTHADLWRSRGQAYHRTYSSDLSPDANPGGPVTVMLVRMRGST